MTLLLTPPSVLTQKNQKTSRRPEELHAKKQPAAGRNNPRSLLLTSGVSALRLSQVSMWRHARKQLNEWKGHVQTNAVLYSTVIKGFAAL
eukprot:6470673-Amphidinium_carterae.1